MSASLAVLAAFVGFSAWGIYRQIQVDKETKAACDLMTSAFPLHTRSWRNTAAKAANPRREAGKNACNFRFLVRDDGNIYECELNIRPSGSVDGKTSKVEVDD